MKFFFFLALISFSLFKTGFAQFREYESAYIVRNSDTIPGLIARTDEIALSKKLLFKGTDGKETSYSTDELEGFGFQNDKLSFEKVRLNINTHERQIDEDRFAKLMVKGAKATLYKLQLSNYEHPAIFLTNNTFVYILKKGQEYYTLGQFEEMMEGSRYRLNKKYYGLFVALFADCHELGQDDFSELKFEDKQVVALTDQYNKCGNLEIASGVRSYESKKVIKHGIEASFSSIRPYHKGEITKSSGLSLGYFWDITSPDVARRNSLRTGINYMYLSYDYSFYRYWYKLETTSFKEHFLRVPLLGQYNISKLNQMNFPFVNLGLSATLRTDAAFQFIDVLPFIDLGVGMYINKMRLSVLVENESFSFKSNKLLTLNMGWRLDKAKRK